VNKNNALSVTRFLQQHLIARRQNIKELKFIYSIRWESRFIRHAGPLRISSNISGSCKATMPPSNTYAQPKPIVWVIRSITEIKTAPREHRTRFVWLILVFSTLRKRLFSSYACSCTRATRLQNINIQRHGGVEDSNGGPAHYT
jgi:hypothetical protein